jgi:hypothetical protein
MLGSGAEGKYLRCCSKACSPLGIALANESAISWPLGVLFEVELPSAFSPVPAFDSMEINSGSPAGGFPPLPTSITAKGVITVLCAAGGRFALSLIDW